MNSQFLIFFVLAFINFGFSEVPTVGQFIITKYKDDTCNEIISTPKGFKGSANPLCWTRSNNTTSILPVNYNSTSQELTVKSFPDIWNCTGVNFTQGIIKCNNKCQTNPAIPSEKLTCSYATFSSSANFTFIKYVDPLCRTSSTGSVITKGGVFCWQTGSTTSLAPFNWSYPSFTVYPFPSSPSCTGYISNTSVIQCDGSCFINPANSEEFYTCTYQSSKYLNINIAIIIILFFLVFNLF